MQQTNTKEQTPKNCPNCDSECLEVFSICKECDALHTAIETKCVFCGSEEMQKYLLCCNCMFRVQKIN